MGAMSKLAVAVVCLSIVGAALWYTVDREPPDLRTAEAASPQSPGSKETLDPVSPVSTETPEREALSPAPKSDSATEKAPPASALDSVAPSKAKAGIRARFVDSTGQPWDAVRFSVANADESTLSSADGRAELSIALENDRRDPIYQFTASRTGCATRTMRATLASGGVVDLGEVVLDREARLRGIVRDSSGAGLGKVTVGLSPVKLEETDPGHLRRHGSLHFDRLLVTHSDEHGAFDLRSVPAGAWRLWGNRDAGGYGVSDPFDVQAGEQKEGLDFEVPALLDTDSIRGRVIDPAGAPVPQANVMLNYESGDSSGTTSNTAKADGTFEFLVYMEVAGDLIASDKDHRFGEASLHDVPPGARDLVLQLTDPSAQPHARLRVHGPANEPVRKVELSSRAGKQNSYSETTLKTNETEPGLYDFQVPAAAFGLTVAAEGYLGSELIKLDPASPPEQIDVALELAPVLRGRVIAAGKAVAGAVVEARREVKYQLTFNGFPCIMNTNAQASGTSGPEGAFTLNLQGREPVYLRCSAPGFAPTIVGPIRVDGPTHPIEIELGLGGAIEGRARAKDGTPVVGAIVGITCGDAHPRTMRSGHDGVFRFDGLSVGSWLVTERDEEFRTDWTSTRSSDEERKIDWSCEVTAGRTTFFDVTLK